MDYKKRFQECLSEVICNPNFDTALIAEYFSTSYIQHVDGKTLNYEQFVAHIEHLKQAVIRCSIDFELLEQHGNTIHSIHIVRVVKNDSSKVRIKVQGQFTFEHNKLILTNETTELLEGDEENASLGWR
ncbi:hypothetical protein VQ643_00395 [Pseudomonas sp. F1_0610]|uniref:hypothetical protein n=1 Tax=Pseudomonas sp. F1_0610 TaxID=3114284 RepID=UPI0039C28E35